MVFNFSEYQGDLLSIFMIWKGGLAIYGGVIAGILYLFYYCKKIVALCVFSLLLSIYDIKFTHHE